MKLLLFLWLLKNSKFKEVSLVWEFRLRLSWLCCQALGINPTGVMPSKSHLEGLGHINTTYGL